MTSTNQISAYSAIGTKREKHDRTSMGSQPHLLIADAHVHLYSCFHLEHLLNSAWINFARCARQRSAAQFTAILFLTEGKNEISFQQLAQANFGNNQNPPPQWCFIPTQEAISLYACNSLKQRILLIAGRQVVTQENLEVLALMTNAEIRDGLPLSRTIETILAAGGVPVIPWGFGKWMGSRGKLVQKTLAQNCFHGLFIGDNGGRPSFWLRPSYFKQAQQQGLQILPGTDPLPLPSQACRPGSFGFTLASRSALSWDKPGKHLREILHTAAPQPYGALESPLQFVRNQIAIRNKANVSSNLKTTSCPLETADIETSSDNYASRFAGKTGAWLLKIQERATLKMLSPYPNAKVLDVGGGHGQLTGALVQQDYPVTVFSSAEVCKARIQKWIDDGRCAFEVGNVLSLPYPDSSFDVVISYRFLAHVTQWQRFLAELARVARYAVIVDYPTVRSFNTIAPYLFKLKKGLEGNTRPYITYREAELVEYFEYLGLRQVERYPQFLLPMVFHRTLKTPEISSASEKLGRALGLTNLFGSPVIAKFRVRSQH